MAKRRTVSRKALAEEAAAAEKMEAAEDAATDTTIKKKAAKKKTKRASRAKKVVEVRLKAFWGVFTHTGRRVGLFEYADREKAGKKAEELTDSPQNQHFVQLVKEVIEE